MGKDTDFQRRAGLDYPRVAAAAAQFDTEQQRLNYTAVIENLTKQLRELRLAAKVLDCSLTDARSENIFLRGLLAEKGVVTMPLNSSGCASEAARGLPAPEK